MSQQQRLDVDLPLRMFVLEGSLYKPTGHANARPMTFSDMRELKKEAPGDRIVDSVLL
jgi:hypothetical protein